MREFMVAGAICLVNVSGSEAKLSSASDYAKTRQGVISYAIIKENRKFQGYHSKRIYPSASLSKAMIAVQFFRANRHRTFSVAEKKLLSPMIRESDNKAASNLFAQVGGGAGLAELARRVGMKEFRASQWWGNTGLSARDQVNFFWQLESLMPSRHRAYGKYLFSNIISYQRWGIPQAFPYWKTYFKGGWRPQDGAIMVNQAALIKLRRRKVAIAVLTRGNPSYEYGHQTIEGIAKRLKANL